MGDFLCVDPATLLILSVDPRWESALGVAVPKLLGRPVTQWIREPSREDFARMLSVAMRERKPRHFKVVLRQGEGAEIPLWISVSRVVGPYQQPILRIAPAEGSLECLAKRSVVTS